MLIRSHSEISREQNIRASSIQVNWQIDGSGLVSDNLLSSFVILVQPPKSCHMQIRHDIIADRQLIVVTSTSLQLEFLNTETEIVHGDGVIVVPNVDVKEQFFQWPRIGLSHALSCRRDVSLRIEKSAKPNGAWPQSRCSTRGHILGNVF